MGGRGERDRRERKERERQEREREGNVDLLFHLFMHSLGEVSMCPDWGSNLQPLHSRMVP